MSTICTLIAVVAAALMPTELVQDDPSNAARYYLAAFDRFERLSEADLELFSAYYADPNAEPPDGLRTALARAAPVLADFERASKKPYVDWALDYEQGIELLLPHLSPMRGIARVQRARIVLDLHDGRDAEAAEGIATLYRVAAQARTDRTLISSLVAQAIYHLADGLVQLGLDHRVFEGATAQRLVRGHATLESPDPFWVAESIAMEQEIVASWMESRFGTEEGRADAELIEFIDLDEEETEFFRTMTDAEFHDHVSEYDLVMDEVAMAFTDPDPEAGSAALKELEQKIENREFGPFVTLLMPAFTKVFERAQISEELVESRAALFRGLAAGTEDPAQHANAVPYYVRAYEMLREIPVAAPPDEQVEDPTDRRAQAAGVLELVREGTTKQRCDFDYLHRSSMSRLCPPYAAGFHELAGFMQESAASAVAEGEREAALEQLELLFRLVGHLSRDNHFLVAVSAHEAFVEAHRLSELLLVGLASDAPERQQLFRAADAMGRSDPFGYITSIEQLRLMSTSLPYFWRIGDRALHTKLIQSAETWTADQMVFVVAVYDALMRQGLISDEREREAAAAALPPDLQRVEDLLEPTQLAAIAAQAPEVDARLRADDSSVLFDRVVPLPAGIELRRSRARADLRAGMSMLRPRADDVSRAPDEAQPAPSSASESPGG